MSPLPELLLAWTAFAAPADPLWIPLPGGTSSPPGTGPTIEAIEPLSNSHMTVLDVRIPGSTRRSASRCRTG